MSASFNGNLREKGRAVSHPEITVILSIHLAKLTFM